MQLETFRGRDLSVVCGEARRALGEDAVVVRSSATTAAGRPSIEVLAARAGDIARLRRMVSPAAPAIFDPVTGRRDGGRPFRIALVGPTGAGKTTTAAKLAVNPDAFGRHRAGFITLDTYRAGAVEQLQAYANAADIPVEVCYDKGELEGALRRLSTCDVIVIDTPGRGPRRDGGGTAWRDIVRELHADETHLVIPVTTRLDLIARLRAEFAETGATHALLTKLDEVPGDTAIAQIAALVSLPVRWVTDGQDVPVDLRMAAPQVLETLGLARGTQVVA
jgi:flagellar biosynthesis protein FlhF